MTMRDTGFAIVFEWIKNEKTLIYQSAELAFKIKREKLETTESDIKHGFEVYISDNPRTKEWRPIRFFKEDSQEAMIRIMKWVEGFAHRLAEDRVVELEKG